MARAGNLQRSMLEDHAHLEHMFNELTAAFEGDARESCLASWTDFERALREHFLLEERFMLPKLAQVHPEEARQLYAEHAEIMRKLANLGVGVDLHLTRADAVADFLAAIGAHAQREERLMYPWLDEHGHTDALTR